MNFYRRVNLKTCPNGLIWRTLRKILIECAKNHHPIPYTSNPSQCKSKKELPGSSEKFFCHAVERTRTSTGVRPLPPQDSVSAIPPLPRMLSLLSDEHGYYSFAVFKCKVELFVHPAGLPPPITDKLDVLPNKSPLGFV